MRGMDTTTIATSATPATAAAATVVAYLDALEAGSGIPTGLLAEDVAFDATVPNWRFVLSGRDAVSGQLGAWFRDPGRFTGRETLWAAPDTAVVAFDLTWVEDGTVMRAHQMHRLTLAGDGGIAAIVLFCGGRWSAGLVDEMVRSGALTLATFASGS